MNITLPRAALDCVFRHCLGRDLTSNNQIQTFVRHFATTTAFFWRKYKKVNESFNFKIAIYTR